jgi:general secretion pathway protein F
MPVFEYKALDSKGKRIRGLITADGPAAARLKLSQDLIYPTDIREVKEGEKKPSAEALVSPLAKLQRVNPVEVTTALRQLATLISSGLPLVESLGGVIEQSEEPKLRKIFTQVRERVLEGNSLAQAMSAHPGIFSHVHVNMVKAGETGGALDIILKRLADFSERRLKIKKKIESAMTYPIFLLLISSIILVFLMTFVMPKVVGIFKGMKLALPWSTQVLIFVTYVISNYWWLLAIGTLILAGGIAALMKTETGGRAWDRVKMDFPLLGRLHRKAVIARFTRTLSILLKSGIPLVDALEISGPAMGNRILEDGVKEATKLVGEGSDLATPLRQKAGFPPLVVQLVRAGEKSGELEEMLAKAAEVYEDDVEATIASLTSIIEPMVILFMGVVVGFIVMAILLPIFEMTSGIRVTK